MSVQEIVDYFILSGWISISLFIIYLQQQQQKKASCIFFMMSGTNAILNASNKSGKTVMIFLFDAIYVTVKLTSLCLRTKA